ncbi:MAG: hypothetical protein AAF494_11425 [Pseudomonadota bacterium]
MSDPRIDQALKRISAALTQIESAPLDESHSDSGCAAGSSNVTALIDAHEKLREDVAETLRELDQVIDELEG